MDEGAWSKFFCGVGIWSPQVRVVISGEGCVLGVMKIQVDPRGVN